MGCTKSINNLYESEENDDEYEYDSLQRGRDIFYKDIQEEEFKDFEEIGSKF